MGGIEIFLIIAGIVVIVCSFLIKDRKNESVSDAISENEIRNTTKEIVREEVTGQLADITEELFEKTERRLDKLVNEKIMAVGNYSDDVLKNIESNHNEVMFLYNMLNDKEETLKNAVRDIEALKQSIRKMTEDMPVKELEKPPVRRGRRPKTAAAETEQSVPEEEIKEQSAESEIVVKEAVVKPPVRRGRKPKTPAKLSPDSTNKDKILNLYKDGKTNIEIAKELSLGVGEVNLVLGLFK